MIFQYPVVALGIAIATIATQAAGVYCEFESKTHFAKLWVSLLYLFFTLHSSQTY